MYFFHKKGENGRYFRNFSNNFFEPNDTSTLGTYRLTTNTPISRLVKSLINQTDPITNEANNDF